MSDVLSNRHLLLLADEKLVFCQWISFSLAV